MKQSQQTKQKTKQSSGEKPSPPSQGSGQSFASAYHEALKWSGTIHTQPQRRIEADMFMGTKMFQSWPDLLIWEAFFNNYNVKTFLELGTGYGGMSLFFALQCHQRGIDFHTFDNVKSFRETDALAQLVNLEGKFHHVDLYNEGHAIISDLITNGRKPLAIFFDNGDKPREWKTFAPLTSPGDFLAVHDWGTEFGENDITAVNVNRILGKASDDRPDGWKSMWFVRV